jgi:hypothetical protein
MPVTTASAAATVIEEMSAESRIPASPPLTLRAAKKVRTPRAKTVAPTRRERSVKRPWGMVAAALDMAPAC